MGPLLAARAFFTKSEVSADGRTLHQINPSGWDRFYRDRWAHDKYVRGVLLEMWRETKARPGDPVLAWAELTGDPERARAYKRARGKGGFVRSSWDEVLELMAAAHVHTVKQHGPDRVVGFSPIPAMSMASFAAGTRFLSMIGGALLSFYDWYADLPIASPQVWGDQTDVPEAADWWNSRYLIMWGSDIPVTRTPDAHFMTEARYQGTEVVAVSPDYADNVKFADDWLAPHPGTDGALAMAMGHVTLTEFFRDRQVPYFTDYIRKYTDLPFLVMLEPRGDAYMPRRFLTAADLLGGGYDYRAAIAVWFRGVLTFRPAPGLMADVPLIFQLHALSAWVLAAIWPFTRLVHVWSAPIAYLWRPYVVYRRRTPLDVR
ncbi:molybdopterin-dependent oxidoreductase [Streptosporangium canum]|uniref:molybdopterin-dependent oxidoreductase n=1 Tax=Streptosporangium canum TaxID=324952 RepID=UPI003F4DC1D0